MDSPPGLDDRNTTRDDRILEAARGLVHEHGLSGMTREAIAMRAGLAVGSVSNFGRQRITNGQHPRGDQVMPRIRDALMVDAVERGDLVVLRMGLATQHPTALAAPEQLRVAALTA